MLLQRVACCGMVPDCNREGGSCEYLAQKLGAVKVKILMWNAKMYYSSDENYFDNEVCSSCCFRYCTYAILVEVYNFYNAILEVTCCV